MSIHLDKWEYNMIRDAMDAITVLDLSGFVKNFDDEGGFMWSNDHRVDRIMNALHHQSHSGSSFACTLRNCQYYFTHPDDWTRLRALYEPEMVADEELTTPSVNETTTIEAGSHDTDLFFEPID
jgi:hypothetical protein